jgi:hypothetical protein
MYDLSDGNWGRGIDWAVARLQKSHRRVVIGRTATQIWILLKLMEKKGMESDRSCL